MKNDKFTCPIYGSTHFEHIISKTHPDKYVIRLDNQTAKNKEISEK